MKEIIKAKVGSYWKLGHVVSWLFEAKKEAEEVGEGDRLKPPEEPF